MPANALAVGATDAWMYTSQTQNHDAGLDLRRPWTIQDLVARGPGARRALGPPICVDVWAALRLSGAPRCPALPCERARGSSSPP
eukprot:2284974-Pyramimonas_sp.AAC.1